MNNQGRGPANGFRVQQAKGSNLQDSQLTPARLTRGGEQRGPDPIRYRYGGLLTYEKPITEFPGDLLLTIAAEQTSAAVTYVRGVDLPNNCVGFRLIMPSDTAGDYAEVSINGGGRRRFNHTDGVFNAEIQSLDILFSGSGNHTLHTQVVGTGD